MVDSNIPDDMSGKLHSLLNEFTKISRETLKLQNLNLLLMPMFKNHNYFIGVDTEIIHLVYTNEGVTSGIVSGNERDLRSKGKLNQKQIIDACTSELGYKDIHYFAFPSHILNLNQDEMRPYLEQISNQYIQEKIKPLIMLEKLGLNESFRYLQNAKSRFDTKTPEGYSNCKADCRNALVSALYNITGIEKIREAVKELGKQGILGEREEEFIISFGDFLSKLYNLSSKSGPHPPLETEEDDTQLVLSVTTSVLNYIANQTIKQRS